MNEKPIPESTPETEPYWQAANEGLLKLPFCTSCQSFFFYPRPWCPFCWGKEHEWKQVSGKGEVLTYSVLHVAPSQPFEGDLPYVLAVIKLAEGPQMMANIVGTKPEKVKIGLPVMVTFEQRGDGQIPQFAIQAE